jgi:hypothetical protein
VKKTVGKLIDEHNAQGNTLDDNIIEYRRAMEVDIVKRLHDTAQAAKNNDLYRNHDFYIVLVLTVDPVLGQPKNIMWARRSCPTPVYKQSVWKFHQKTDSLEFLWSIPDKLMYIHILNNIGLYLKDKETAIEAKFVTLMESGELLKWVKRENGEKIDAVIKINNEAHT